MSESGSVWLLLVDRRGARLLRGSLAAGRRARLDPYDSIENVEEDHERGRPCPRRGKDGHSYASWSKEESEHQRRYAARVAQWVDSVCREEAIDRLVVFADPRLAAELRPHYPPGVDGRIEEIGLDLAGLQPRDLLNHDAVRPLLESKAVG